MIARRLWPWRAYQGEHAPGAQLVLRIERAGAAPRDVMIQLAAGAVARRLPHPVPPVAPVSRRRLEPRCRRRLC